MGRLINPQIVEKNMSSRRNARMASKQRTVRRMRLIPCRHSGIPKEWSDPFSPEWEMMTCAVDFEVVFSDL